MSDIPKAVEEEVAVINQVFTNVGNAADPKDSHLNDNSNLSIRVTKKHLELALSSTQPSLPETERRKFDQIFSAFQEARKKKVIGDNKPAQRLTDKPRVTLS